MFSHSKMYNAYLYEMKQQQYLQLNKWQQQQ
jgi:hypothetical protein